MSRTSTRSKVTDDRKDQLGLTNGDTTAPATTTETKEVVRVPQPKIRTVKIPIRGVAPYLQCRFPEKAQRMIMQKQLAGDQPGKKAKRGARDYEADFQGSMHRIKGGGYGIPASAFRAACISACRLVGFRMTVAKLSIFIVPDGYDEVDSMPLVRITGTPKKHIMMGRNSDGSPDVRVRALFDPWSAILTMQFDEDQFSLTDVVNLLARVGQQVGIGEGRHDSKNSTGMGFGVFEVQQ